MIGLTAIGVAGAIGAAWVTAGAALSAADAINGQAIRLAPANAEMPTARENSDI